MDKKDLLKLKNRKTIYEYILDNPGLHLRKIIKDINLSDGTIRHHIRCLIDHGLIYKDKEKHYTRFYVIDSEEYRNKKIISYLRNKNTRAIILFYFFYVCGSITKISNVLEKDKKNISNYVNKMVEDNILEIASTDGSKVSTGFERCTKKICNPYKSENIYRLKHPYLLNDVLISLKNKYFDDETTDELLEFLNWIFLQKNKRPKIIKDDKEYLEKAIDSFFEIFPISFRA